MLTPVGLQTPWEVPAHVCANHVIVFFLIICSPICQLPYVRLTSILIVFQKERTAIINKSINFLR